MLLSKATRNPTTKLNMSPLNTTGSRNRSLSVFLSLSLSSVNKCTRRCIYATQVHTPYVHVCIYIIYMYLCMHVCTYVCMYVCIRVCMYAHMSVCMYADMSVYTYIYIHTHIRSYVYIHTDIG